MHIRKVIKLLKNVLFFLAFIMLIPALLAFFYKETEALKAFMLTNAYTLCFASLLHFFSYKTSLKTLSQRDGYLFTTLTWVFCTVFGALPLVFTKTLPNYSDAFFEIMSGFTTTGASRIDNVEGCFKSILFWRSLTNWLGGMGIVVLFIAILPALSTSRGAFNLMGAETVGPVKSKLTPKTKQTAIILWLIYLGVTVLEIVLLLFGKLSLFDAITTSFSTVSTAGFCTKNASVASFNSAYVDGIITVFMLLSSLNFSLYYQAFKGKFSSVFKDTETRVFLTLVSIAILASTLYLTLTKVYGNFFSSLRYTSFHVASVISTTGFSNGQFMSWPSFALFILIFLMFIGGCAGSTGGGIKIIRHYVLFSYSRNVLKSKTHSNSVFTLIVNGEVVDKDMISSILSFFVLYVFTWIISAIIISFSGIGIIDCLSSTLLSIGNIGLGFGELPFSRYPHWTNWVFSFLMLVGRLEIFTVYVIFTRLFWKR